METRMLGRVRDAARASPAEMVLLALLATAVFGGTALAFLRHSDPPPPPLEKIESKTAEGQEVPREPGRPAKMVVVHVAGLVAAPGVYELPENSRVKDAIAAAGGPKDGGDIDALNLAAVLSDGQKIVVSKPGELAAGSQEVPAAVHGGGAGNTPATGKINLNTASAAELDTLPSVGPVIAERIISFRQKGRFTSVAQLKDVEGIGPKKYEGIKDLVTV